MDDSYAEAGYEIQVGDTIRCTNAFGPRSHKVHRVTRTRAYVQYNEHAEGCFGRFVNGFGCAEPMPRRHTWSTTRYCVIPTTH